MKIKSLGEKMKKIRCLIALLVTSVVGCVSFDPDRDSEMFDPLQKIETEAVEVRATSETEIKRTGQVEELPKAQPSEVKISGSFEEQFGVSGRGEILANLRNMPLPDFINEALGERLGLSYLLDPSLAESSDLVTLSLSEALSPSEFLRATKSVLAEYGISMKKDGPIIKVDYDKNAAGIEKPLLVTGNALPNIPSSHRRIFHYHSLKVLQPAQVRSNLQILFTSEELQVINVVDDNAVLLLGPASAVRESIEALEYLDRPFMRGKNSAAYRPVYIEAGELAGDLTRVLQAEGYVISNNIPYGSIMILDFSKQQRILIFANDASVLDHVIAWARELDSDKQSAITDGFFTYEANNITAQHIARVLSAFENDSNQGKDASRALARNNGAENAGGEGNGSVVASYMGGKLVVDGNRNVIFFKGSGKEWARIRRLIEQIDQPIPMVLIEVLLVELTLSEGENSGVEWLFRSKVGDYGLRGSTRGGLSLSGNGLSLVMDSAGETRAIVNAFYQNDKASIRSSPKLLVKSGETAQIEVGNEIPILTQNAQSIESINAPILQSVEYRKTGVLLSINPVVQASGLVDLIISQELSEQQSIGALGSPVILQRSLETALAIKDGGSILLGGLISDNQIEAKRGLPVLSKIPLLNKLASVDTQNTARTELLMLVSTFVLKDNQSAVEITETLKKRFDANLD